MEVKTSLDFPMKLFKSVSPKNEDVQQLHFQETSGKFFLVQSKKLPQIADHKMVYSSVQEFD